MEHTQAVLSPKTRKNWTFQEGVIYHYFSKERFIMSASLLPGIFPDPLKYLFLTTGLKGFAL